MVVITASACDIYAAFGLEAYDSVRGTAVV